jgi:hypothetical protein
MKLALPLLISSLILFASCSTVKPLEVPVCIWNDSMKAFSCAQANPYRKWIMLMDEGDGWVCLHPDVNKEILTRAARCAK